FFFQAEDGIRDSSVTGVQTCALPISTTKSSCWDVAYKPRTRRWRQTYWEGPLLDKGEVSGSSPPRPTIPLFSPVRRSCRRAFCRSEEHTSELQSHLNLVCRLLLEKKK